METLKCQYKVDKNENYLRIIGEDFYKYNQLKYIVICKNKVYKYKQLIPIKDLKDDKFIIKIMFIENNDNNACMFKDCISLLTINKVKNNNKKNYHMNNLKIIKYNNYLEYFGKNYELSLVYEEFEEKVISKSTKDDFTSKDKKYSNDNSLSMYNSEEFSEIPKISEEDEKLTIQSFKCWKNKIIFRKNQNTNLSEIFYNCISLISLPDISNWNTENVEEMEYMFFNCIKLISLPDISKWKTDNVIDMSYIFCNCIKKYHYLIYQNGKLIMLLI